MNTEKIENKPNTSIITHIRGKIRVSSIWRHYGNDNFSSWAWETLVFDGDEIIEQADSNQYADSVIDLHERLYKKYMTKED